MLDQVDYNGNSTKYGPVAAYSGISTVPSLTVYAINSGIGALINHIPAKQQGVVSIYDLNGRVLHQTKAYLQKGANRIELPFTVSAGVYILKVDAGNINLVQKFNKPIQIP